MKKILVATNNKGKFNEISELLNRLDIQALSAFEYNLSEPQETSPTFAGNALIKAQFYGKMTNQIALSDDSGLCVDDLDGIPGVHSARFACNNGKKDFDWAFKKIFDELARKKIFSDNKPSAHFICNLCLFNPKNDFAINFEGRVDGHLTYPPRGANGFGYDPIFIKNNFSQTFGEISADQKHSISHRFLAFLQLENWLKKNYSFFD